jgi:pSer/pThr/pTyr-binding forkhead associated (FHA) protein
VAPPTPPVGLTSQPLGSGVALSPLAMTAQDGPLAAAQPRVPMRTAPVAAVDGARAAPPAPPRPPAPDFRFGARPAPVQEAAPDPEALARCASCGNMNQRGLRFCITCGKSLTPSLSPPPPQVASAAPQGFPPPPAPQGLPPPPAPVSRDEAAGVIAPARVVDLGPTPSTKSATRVCARCRGTNDVSSQFCKFCGVSLTTPEPDRASPVPTKPAAAPAPPVPPIDLDTERKIASAAQVAMPAISPVAESVRAEVAPVVSSMPMTPPVAESQYRALSLEKAKPSEPAATDTSGSHLVAIARDGGEGPSFPLGDVADIGRSEGHVLVADDRYVSPRHARLTRKGDRVLLRDLGSINGVYLRIPASSPLPGATTSGEHPVSPNPALPAAISAPLAAPLLEVPLSDQDLFLVGQQVLRFELVKDAEEGLGAVSEHGTLLFGTPASPRYARLSQRTVEGVARDVFYIRKAETVLGRESGDIVFTEDPFLSRRHALLRFKRDTKTFTLADLGSSNGTFLRIREEVELKDGDQFRIGQQLFRVDLRS